MITEYLLLENNIILYKELIELENMKYATEKLPSLKDSDYLQGYIERYFVRQKNSNKSKIIEINKKQWISLQANSFYSRVSLRWKISGDSQYVYNSNLKSISEADKEMSGIKDKLQNNLFQFYKQ